MQRKKADLLIIAGFLLILTGTLTYVRPFMLRTYREISALRFILSIMIPSESAAEIADMNILADAYNAEVAAEQAVHGFIYTETYDDESYDTLLYGPRGIMCVIEIPKIDVLLPVGHGTSTDILSEYAGHLYGTSLPLGGESTHAVIAAHAGLPDRELFTGLPRLSLGDEFNIYVLGEKHIYTVDMITEIRPSETSILRISEGKDNITLMTCVPYGINTRRLLVRGVRNDAGEQKAATAYTEMHRSRLLRLLFRVSALGTVPGIELIFFIFIKMRSHMQKH